MAQFLKESVCKASLKGTQEISLYRNQTKDRRQALNPPALRLCSQTNPESLSLSSLQLINSKKKKERA